MDLPQDKKEQVLAVYNEIRPMLTKRINALVKFESFAQNEHSRHDAKQVCELKAYELCVAYIEGKLKRANVNSIQSLYYYLHTSLKNAIIDFRNQDSVVHISRRDRGQIQSLQDLDAELPQTMRTAYSSLEHSPELHQNDMRKALESIRSQNNQGYLQEEMKLVVSLHVKEMRIKELAENEGVNCTTIYCREKRAMKEIRSTLIELGYDSLFYNV